MQDKIIFPITIKPLAIRAGQKTLLAIAQHIGLVRVGSMKRDIAGKLPGFTQIAHERPVACKGLEERALAERTPNEADGRSHLLDLTAEGREMYSEIMPLARQMEQRLFDGFSEEELALFRTLLDRARKQAEDLDAEELGGGFGIG